MATVTLTFAPLDFILVSQGVAVVAKVTGEDTRAIVVCGRLIKVASVVVRAARNFQLIANAIAIGVSKAFAIASINAVLEGAVPVVCGGIGVVIARICVGATLKRNHQRLGANSLGVDRVLASTYEYLHASLKRKVTTRCHPCNQHFQIISSHGIRRPIVRGTRDVK